MIPGRITPFVALACLSLTAPVVQAARQDGLAVYLTFDDEANPFRNYAEDLPGREPVAVKINGDSTYARFGKGPEGFGRCAEFVSGGLSGWSVNLGKLDDIYDGDFTVAFWAFIPKTNNGMIVSNRESFVSPSPGWSFNSKYAEHYDIHASGADKPYKEFTNALEKQWRHIAYVCSRTEGKVTIYVDGAKAKIYSLPSATAKLDGGFATVIGASSNGTLNADSSVDEFGIWKRALAPAEIAALGTKPGKHIPEASSFAWAGAGAAVAGLAALKRRRAKKSV